jgi:hypothetical protein
LQTELFIDWHNAEGWVQFGVWSLRSGEPLPALSGTNPSRLAALQAGSIVKKKKRLHMPKAKQSLSIEVEEPEPEPEPEE